jgi:DNA-binding Lrp family transcriptional regulator
MSSQLSPKSIDRRISADLLTEYPAHSAVWLADALGITFTEVCRRLERRNWNRAEDLR